uniref:Kinesin motor domain-containing protein n=1 Tax=Trichuris muris TaxID=70415 RepID=A0A5S6Q6U0_TRIMR
MSGIPQPKVYKRMRQVTLDESGSSPTKVAKLEEPPVRAGASNEIKPVVSEPIPRKNAGQPIPSVRPSQAVGIPVCATAKGQLGVNPGPGPTLAKGLLHKGRENYSSARGTLGSRMRTSMRCRQDSRGRGFLQRVAKESDPLPSKATDRLMLAEGAEVEELKAHLQKCQSELSEAQSQVGALNGRLDEGKSQITQLELRLEEETKKNDDLTSRLAELRNDFTTLQTDKELVDCKNARLQSELENCRLQCTELEAKFVDACRKFEEGETLRRQLHNSVMELKTDKELVDCKNARLQSELENCRSQCTELQAKLVDACRKFEEGETLRRQLHNSVMELKGNIRVFCRMRPLLRGEIGAADANGVPDFVTFSDVDSRQIELLRPASTLSSSELLNSTVMPKGKQKFIFTFDCVFPPSCTQVAVFQEIEALVQSALDGYNVCIFAYGQTGSGKTYTMEGSSDDKDCPGMIVLAVRKIFERAADLRQFGWQYEMSVSFLEIYNESLHDLLTEKSRGEAAPSLEIKLVPSQVPRQQHEVTVPGLTTVAVTSVDEVVKLIGTAGRNRAVAATRCNDRSSRSHSVFSMHVKSRQESTGLHFSNYLNFIDLAGSERLKESGSEGLRLKETICINKSLTCLGQVFTALSKKDKHVPYRNSKLTYLLQNCLGGDCKTLMFVNLSPKEDNFGETICSLHFASTVNRCNIGVATRRTC